MPPQQPNQYDFIMDNSKQNRGFGASFLQNPRNRIIFSVLFVSIILILVIVGFSIFRSLGRANNNDLIDLMARQTEIIRIAEIGMDDASGQSVKSQISTLNSFMKSDYELLSEYLSNNNIKPEPLALKAHFDSSAEETLNSAKTANRFDSEVLEILDKETTAYKKALTKAVNATDTPKREEALDTVATNISIYEGKPAEAN